MNRARIGCSGWNYLDWRGRLYPRAEPRRRWLELYAQRFDTVEVNATFYRLPARETVAAWAAQTPSGFSFAVKASRYLTHVRRLQLPESFARDDARLDAWARRIGQWRRRGDVYAYFNNDWCGYAPDNAASLDERLRVRDRGRGPRTGRR